MAFNRYLFMQKGIVDVRMGSKYASEDNKVFLPDVSKVKLMIF